MKMASESRPRERDCLRRTGTDTEPNAGQTREKEGGCGILHLLWHWVGMRLGSAEHKSGPGLLDFEMIRRKQYSDNVCDRLSRISFGTNVP